MKQSERTLDTLLECKPLAFEALARTGGTAHGVIDVESDLAIEPRRFALRIKCIGRSVRVRETEPGEQLPTACPERHIESDSNLCLGLKAGQDIATPRECSDWWSHLYQFLVLQISAERTGRWPRKYALAHGEGGDAQVKAAQTARRLGLEGDYAEYLLGRQNRIADLVSNYGQRRADALKKGRDIAHIDDALLNRAMILARERGSRKLTDRKRARLVRALAKFDFQRVVKEQAYWDACRESGMTCCGTMRRCPLRENPSVTMQGQC